MTTSTRIESGERISFIELFQKKDINITIPIIQRDYAQGRKSTANIRELFLQALKRYLQENKGNRDLDFIYGSLNQIDEENRDFLPLDGQQRLTTLFLLHFYLANHDNNLSHFREVLISKNKSRFRYKTRVSSNEFCDLLVQYDLDLEAPTSKDHSDLSNQVRNQKWYHLSWDKDPTVQAMLIMLDAIHAVFYDESGMYERLIRMENPVITFQFLNLDEFDLSDELYIKMNARGKSLTPYENFKAKLEQHLSGIEVNKKFYLFFHEEKKKVKLQEYFSFHIDTTWSNLFWTLRKKDSYEIDDQILNFIQLIAINNSVQTSEGRRNLRSLFRIKNDNSLYENLERSKILNKQFILELITVFELFSDPKIGSLALSYKSPYIDSRAVFSKLIHADYKDAAYTSRIIFYAFYKYLIQWNSNIGLDSWMRVIFNLTENKVPYNDETEFARSINSIDKLLPHSNEILKNISTKSLKVSGFNDKQYKEEVIKATLILKSDDWRKIIIAAEQDLPYLTGQLNSILTFSGVFQAVEDHLNFNWSNTVDLKLQQKFIFYTNCLKSILTAKGIKKTEEFLIERALLSYGDYLLTKRKNNSFLIGSDRDISWKRLLFGDTNWISHKRRFLKCLFDDPLFDNSNLEFSLEAIISRNKASVKDWRFYFVESYKVLRHYDQRLIRILNKNNIRILGSTSIGGYQAELQSLFFYYEKLKPNLNDFKPFSNIDYFNSVGQNSTPCAYLDHWYKNGNHYAIDIFYLPKKKLFGLRFFNRKNDLIGKEVISVLKEKGFEFIEQKNEMVQFVQEEYLLIFLKKITSELLIQNDH